VAAQVICRVIAGLRVLKERAGQDHAVVAEYLKEESFLTRRRGGVRLDDEVGEAGTLIDQSDDTRQPNSFGPVSAFPKLISNELSEITGAGENVGANTASLYLSETLPATDEN
jgi:hypothetical protein